MKDTVIVKSFPNGISLIMKEEPDFEEILSEIAFKFAEAKNFFGKANMVLSIEGRSVSDDEEMRILDAIQENSDLTILCIVGRDVETNKKFIRTLQQVEESLREEDDGQFYRGSIKNNEILETDNSIVILGDVYPGSMVVSAKNVIVLGGLYGEACAGESGRDGAYIVALEMEPERIKIGNFKYRNKDKQSKWGIHLKVQPKIAYVKNDKIVFETLTKELLSSF